MLQYKVGSSTPWGPAQAAKLIAGGIIRFDTASHGGYWLSDEKVAELPPTLRELQTFAGPNWYEEDCDWAIVVAGYPSLFPAVDVDAALSTLSSHRKLPCAMFPVAYGIAVEWKRENGAKYRIGSMCSAGHGWRAYGYRVADGREVLVQFPKGAYPPALFDLDAQVAAGARIVEPKVAK